MKDDNNGVEDEKGHTGLIGLENVVEDEPEVEDDAGAKVDDLEEPKVMKEIATAPTANVSGIGNGDIVEQKSSLQKTLKRLTKVMPRSLPQYQLRRTKSPRV